MVKKLRNIVLLGVLLVLATFGVVSLIQDTTSAQGRRVKPQGKVAQVAQNPIEDREDIRFLPAPLKARIVELADRPSTYEPMRVFKEADDNSQLFGYYLLDTTHFQPNVFTTTIPGINDGVKPTATGANHDRPTIASVRLVLEPKPGLPTDPNDPGAFIDIFTDISGLFVINNESGWYEGWMIHDLRVPNVTIPNFGRKDFGTITLADAKALRSMGSGNNVPGNFFTLDGNAPRFPSAGDHFPDSQTNLVPLALSMGAYNCLQQSDCHSYWEFNQYTDWVFPQFELPFSGGFGDSFAAGRVAFLSTVVPGSGPSGTGPTGPGPTGGNDPRVVGDNPDDPRDPDRGQESSLQDEDRPMPPNPEHKEKRTRFIPSGLANEILLDVYLRVASFEPDVKDKRQRLFDAYASEVARIDENGDGIVSFEEADLEDTSDGGQSNDRLYIPATEFNRFAITREINDGLLAPRFAPSQRAWVLSGDFVLVSPAVPASTGRDDDNR